jgi:hypothetical protein
VIRETVETTSAARHESDDALLERVQRRAFEYFRRNANPVNGLIADTTRRGAPSSIAVVGFALSAYPVGVERGWMKRTDAVACALAALRFFDSSDQSGGPEATGYHGFYYHFLDMRSGTRMWRSEISLIDTALLIAGMLTAGAYFDGDSQDESELRRLAETLYRRVDWRWAQRERGAVTHGWKPECGFLNYGWEGYSEAILLYVLGLGSPTHALTEASYPAWTVTYQWENLYGHDVLYAGPLFIHQYSHAWIDFRGIRDVFMREKGCDYFENSRRATYAQRAYAIANPLQCKNYGATVWGITASDGPGNFEVEDTFGERVFRAYSARGIGGVAAHDDCTLAPTAAVASIPFAPEIAIPAVLSMYRQFGQYIYGTYGFLDAFNPTFTFNDVRLDTGRYIPGFGWVAEDYLGIDQGALVAMIENYRSGLIWSVMRENRYVRDGLTRAGFSGGWLAASVQ